MRCSSIALAALCFLGLAAPGVAEAQVYIQQQYGQPQYVQPQYAQPQYAPQGQYCRQHRECTGEDARCLSGVCRMPVSYSEGPIWGLLAPGIAALAAGYVVNVIVSVLGIAANAFSSSDDPWGWGFVPLIGPWAQLGLYGYEDGAATYFAIDGLVQAAGLAMIILGAVLKSREPVYALGPEGGPTLALLPTFGSDGGGLSATLRY